MLAKIVNIEKDKIVLKNRSGKFINVTPDKLQFDYKLGDTIEIEKNGDEYYYLPHNSATKNDIDDFWEDEENPEDARQTASASRNAGKLVGLGGWLTFFIVATIIGIAISIFKISNNNISSDDCSTLNTSYHGLCNDITPFINIEIGAIIVVVILRLIGLIMVTQRKKAGISMNVIAFSVQIIWNVIDIIVAMGFYTNSKYGLPSSFSSSLMSSLLPGAIINTGVAAAWIPYFLKSERVKNTLTKE